MTTCGNIALPGRAPVVFNTGPRRFVYNLDSWLNLRGIGKIDKLILLDHRQPGAGAAAELVARHETATLAILAPARARLGKVRLAQEAAGGRWRRFDDKRELALPEVRVQKRVESDGSVRYDCWVTPGGHAPIEFSLTVSRYEKSVLRLRPAPGRPEQKYELFYSNQDRQLSTQ